MSDSNIVTLLEHPLAGLAIAAALCVYHPIVLWGGKRVFQAWFHEPLADGNIMKQVRMLGSELSTISMVAMLKAVRDSSSNLTLAIHKLTADPSWQLYAWLTVLYLLIIFTPSVFVRYALLERDRAEDESTRDWSLFLWRWTLVSWLLGFVNLHVALRFMAQSHLPQAFTFLGH